MRAAQNDRTGKLAQALAIALFEKGSLSLGQAARTAELSQWEFRGLLSALEVSPHYDVAELEEDLCGSFERCDGDNHVLFDAGVDTAGPGLYRCVARAWCAVTRRRARSA